MRMFYVVVLALFASPTAQAWQFTPRVETLASGRAVTLAQGGTVCPESPADTFTRQRMLNVAVAAWARFGYPVWDLSTPRTRTVPLGQGIEILPAALNPKQTGTLSRLLQTGIKEDEKELDIHIGSMWATTPDAAYVLNKQNQIWGINTSAGWADAWSAAFTSWVMCEAGVKKSDFPRSSWHWEYVDHALASKGYIYRAEDITSATLPAAGDLICADRAHDNIYTQLSDRKQGTGRALHCDIVVKTDTRNKKLYAIGGNVLDSVTMTVVGLERVGKGKSAQWRLERTTQRPWFAVLRLGAGGQNASLDKAMKEVKR
ncbi:MAG: DUF2272 domain-containing protein [Alphaproteobacteria bacterium]